MIARDGIAFITKKKGQNDHNNADDDDADNTLQEETEGMSGMIGVGTMVADMLYFNQVERARHWYTHLSRPTN